jgi:uncharacterized protein with GYD domain
MPKFLIDASYSQEGIKGVIASGGSSRVAAVTSLVESMGGSMESFYFTFGGDDVVAIADLPDNVSAAAIAMAVGSSGALSSYKTTLLLTAEEMDAAAAKTPGYQPPGS